MKPLQLSLTALLLAFSLQAQAIVNIENMRLGKPQDGFSGRIDLSISGKNGNTDKDEVGLDGRLQWHEDKTTDFIVLSYDYGQNNEQRNTHKAFLHARHVVQFRPKLAWEAFVQAEENEFARLSYRGLLGGGVRFTLIDDKNLDLFLGTGLFYAKESLEERAGLTDHGSDSFGRGSIYLTYKHKLNKQLRFVSTTYYQPRLNDTADYRALEQAALVVKMTDKLSLRLSLDVSHDSRPPQAVKKTDSAYKTSIGYRF